METLFSNLNTLGNAIGWTLIHFLWQGVLLFIGYWLITRIFLKNKIHLQYWLGIVFISLCLILPIRELFLQLNSYGSNQAIHQLGITIPAIQSNGLLNPVELFIMLMQKIIPYLVIFWVLVVTVISTHLANSWFSLIKLSKQNTSTIPNNLVKKLKTFSRKLKLKFQPIITISEKIDVPATFGFFKPVILLPTSLINRLPQEQMEAILLHEMCHIKRADFLHNILQLLVETLFFYHPLTKWISKDVRRVREQCCDDLVIKLEANPLVYAKALTNIATIYNNSTHNNPSSHIQIAVNDGELLSRIKFLMLEKRTKSPFISSIVSFLIAITMLLIFNNLLENTHNKSEGFNIITVNKNKGTENTALTLNKSGYNLPNIKQLLSQKIQAKNKIVVLSKTENAEQVKQISKKPRVFNKKLEVKNSVHNIPIHNISNKDYPSSIIDNTKKAVLENITSNNVDNPSSENAGNFDKGNSKAPSINHVNTYPTLIKRVQPKYKRSLQVRGIEGSVILSFSISQTGRVKNVTIDKNSITNALNTSAIRALKSWRFDSKTVTSTNINNRYQQIFDFTLTDDKICRPVRTGSRLTNAGNCKKTIKSFVKLSNNTYE